MSQTQKDQTDRLVDELGSWLEQYLSRKNQATTVEKTTTASQLERDVLNYLGEDNEE